MSGALCCQWCCGARVEEAEDEAGAASPRVAAAAPGSAAESPPLTEGLLAGEGATVSSVRSARSYGSARSSLTSEGLARPGHWCGNWKNRRGLELWEQRFEPPGGAAPVAAVVFLHGVHEHSARYDHVLEALARELRVVVHAYDQQSHGRSEDVRGLRGACDSFDEFVVDAADFCERVRAGRPAEQPLFVLGQSFGALVACHLALRRPELVSGLLLSSPAINIEWTLALRVQARAGALASAYTPDLPLIPAVRPEDMSKDPAAVQEYVNDPLVTVGPLRCRLGFETLGAFKELGKRRGELKVPHLLVVFGDTDRCCSLGEARLFVDAVPVPNKQLKVFLNMYHTLFHEPEHNEVITHVVEWLRPLLGVDSDGGSSRTS